MRKTYIKPQAISVSIENQTVIAASVIGTGISTSDANAILPSLSKRSELDNDDDWDYEAEAPTGFDSLW